MRSCYIPPGIVLPIQQVGFNCDFPPQATRADNSLHVFLVYTTPHCIYKICNLNIVTVNTCTCTDVFTVTTKDQSDIIINSYSTGGHGIYGYSKQTSSSGYAFRLSLFSAINPCYNCNIISRHECTFKKRQ